MLAVYAVHANVPGFGAGYYGVDVFFVVSGFLITSLLLREFAAAGRISLRAFWARRFFRLGPELALLLLGAAFFAREVMVFSHSVRDYWIVAASAVTLSTNWLYVFVPSHDPGLAGGTGLLWSLAIEEQFYLCLPPLLAWLLRRRTPLRRLVLGVGAAALASAVLRVVLYQDVPYPNGYYNTFTRLDGLLLGVVLGLLMSSPRGVTALLARARPWHGWAAAAGLAALVVPQHVWFAHHGGFAAVALLTATLLVAVHAFPRGRLARLLAWRPLVFTGRISYGFYLFHLCVIYVVATRLAEQRWLVRTTTSFTVTFAIASVTYLLVYRPVTAWRRRRFAG